MQLVLAERATPAQDVLRCRGDRGQRGGRREPLLGGQILDLAAELDTQLVIVGCDQRSAVKAEVAGRDRVDRSTDDVRDDELAAVGRLVIGLAA